MLGREIVVCPCPTSVVQRFFEKIKLYWISVVHIIFISQYIPTISSIIVRKFSRDIKTYNILIYKLRRVYVLMGFVFSVKDSFSRFLAFPTRIFIFCYFVFKYFMSSSTSALFLIEFRAFCSACTAKPYTACPRRKNMVFGRRKIIILF